MVATATVLPFEDCPAGRMLESFLPGNEVLVEYLTVEMEQIGATGRTVQAMMGLIDKGLSGSVIRVMPSDLGRLGVIGDDAAERRLMDHLSNDEHHRDDYWIAFTSYLMALKHMGPVESLAPGVPSVCVGDSQYQPLLRIFVVAYALLAGCTFDAVSNAA